MLSTVVFVLLGGLSSKAEPTASPTATPTKTPVKSVVASPTMMPTVIPTSMETASPAVVPVVTTNETEAASLQAVPTAAIISEIAPIPATEPTTIGIIGDSRTCSLIVTLCQDKTWEKIYMNVDYDNNISNAAFKKGKYVIALCGEAKGYYQAGSADRTLTGLISLFESNKELKTGCKIQVVDLFGINDAWMRDKKAPASYMLFDSQIKGAMGRCDSVYHCTAGPINKEGTVWPGCNNNDIKKFNAGFVPNEDVDVLDLFSYLLNSGYEAPISDIDPTGLHYDMATDVKVLNYIINNVIAK